MGPSIRYAEIQRSILLGCLATYSLLGFNNIGDPALFSEEVNEGEKGWRGGKG